MTVELIPIKCPQCDAALDIEAGRDQVICDYCGTKILLHNENEFIYRHVDEADVKQAETDRVVRLKQLELAEKKWADDKKAKVFKIKLSLILGIIGISMMVIGYMAGKASGDSSSGFYMLAIVGFFPLLGAAFVWLFSGGNDGNSDIAPDDKATVPPAIMGFEKKNYTVIEALLLDAGFTNVRCVALNDLTVGLLKKPGMVESITIDGEEILSGGKEYPKDAFVIVSYHSLSR